MSAQQDFLVELGTEELPPTSLKMLSDAFCDSCEAQFKEIGLAFEHIQAFATPRRLALLVKNLDAETARNDLTVWGPPAKIAYDDKGDPSKALLGFLKKNDVPPDAVSIANDGKIDKIQCVIQTGGEPATALLPGIIEKALAALPIPKRMRWGSSRDEFVRPAQWLVMLFGQEVIPCRILGLESGNTTRGHRFHANKTITIGKPADYENLLLTEGKVIANFEHRQRKVHEQVAALGETLGGRAVIDPDLLDEVTALVEWPVALAGAFEEGFLSVPAEALISSMKEHQKYFHVEDAQGKLKAHFITVSNIESEDPAQVISGNEKVIRPRLADAAFFFETDKKISLQTQREKLRTVVFQTKLGSVFDKTERIAELAAWLAEALGTNVNQAKRAGELSKADLVSNMVYEFADMQGIAGQYYAEAHGEDSEVARAIKEQYLPKFAKDELPKTDAGLAVALADRLDTLSGIFGIGQSPTGSKDPFALRRASLAVLRLLVEKGLNLDLKALLAKAYSLHSHLDQARAEQCTDTVLTYMLERFRSWYEDAGVPVAVYQSVAAKKLTTPIDINKRVYAVQAFNALPEAEALAAANKRVSNILNKQSGKVPSEVDSSLLQDPAEGALAEALVQAKKEAEPYFAKRDYEEALKALAQLRTPIDAFFDDVMVMVDDEALKLNRLALLQSIRNVFLEVADISYLAATK